MSLHVLPDGRIDTSYAGGRTTGEGNLEEMANLVVLLLNEWGEGWGAPRRPQGPEDGVDMIADGPLGQLRLQITRVPSVDQHWASIHRTGRVSTVADAEHFASDLIDVIRRKAAHYPREVRGCTMLVLDGSQSLNYDLPPTLNAYRNLYLGEAQAAGFQDIFLVGAVRFINLLRPPEGSTWFSVA